jgi:serine O-acetyltransferase
MMSGKTLSGKSAFHCDLEKYYLIAYGKTDPGLIQKMKVVIMSMGLHCIAVYRFGQAANRLRKRHPLLGRAVRMVYLVINYLILFTHKVALHEGGEIGAGFHISHVGNIYIGPCKIGENCTVTHNVTLGQGFEATGDRVPTIGDEVWIGTASVVSGNVTIGDSVTISAGSILSRSVPARCLVAGNPARLITKDYDNSGMIVYEMPGRSQTVTEPEREETEISV